MKKLAYILAPIFVLLVLGSCQKESNTQDDPRTDYYKSMKGEQHDAVKVEIYHVLDSDQGDCQGYFIRPTSEYFDFIIEVGGGVPDSILNNEDLENMRFELDFEFTGVSYNCTKTYKRIGDQPKGQPVEIQQVMVSRVVLNQ
ncbi:MAG: hypothetical protein ACI9GM_001315 [Salibacteraceae bacterium]|jgi:hypothetical protein